MTWIKLDDKTPRHPKVAGLSDRAKWAWLSSLCYASEFLTDGAVPTAFLVTVPRRVQDEIVGAGLWRDTNGAIEIHDYLEHQRDKASIRQQRDKNKNRQQRFRHGSSHADGNADGNAARNGVTNAPVTLLEESRRELEKKEPIQKTAQRPRSDRFDEWYAAYPKKVGKGAALKAWERIRPDAATVDRMLDALKWQRNQPNWLKDNGEFIPNPATYLNAARWEDEPFFTSTRASVSSIAAPSSSLRIIDEMEAAKRNGTR